MSKISSNKLILISFLIFLVLFLGFLLKERVVLALSDSKDTSGDKNFIEKILDFIAITDSNKIKKFEEVSLLSSLNLIKNENINNSLYINDFKIPTEGKVVLANLDEMNIKTYENGIEINEYKIIAIGKDADSSETTPGKFQILSKETNHFSRITKVWMPYSMQFFGNFFIHGWPYYPNGVPISSKNSGGCIRLSTNDALSLFKFVEIGTPVILTGDTKDNDIESENNGNLAQLYEESIRADSYLIANLDTGKVLFSKDINEKKPIYSITKLMTALVYLETVNQESFAFVNNSVFKDETEKSNIKAGSYIKMSDLIYPLLMESSNVSANIIAESRGVDRIVEDMNKRAIAFDLNNTNFVDTSGKSSENVSTAKDVFKFVKYLSKYKDYIIDISLKKEYKSSSYIWNLKSPYINESWYVGGIMNYYNKENNSGVFLVQKGETQKENFIIILLDSDSIKNDVDLILDLL
jgi:hypothetical protein